MKKSRQLIIMCGPAASGKSTWIQNHKDSFKGNVLVVSRDAIRFSLVKENEDYISKEKEVFNEFIYQIKEGLKFNDVVIVDATHLTIGSRTKLFRALGKTLKGLKIIAIVIKPTLNECLEHNNNRTGRAFVPRGQIRRMWYQFTKPTLEEGFDEIWEYKGYKYIIEEKEN